MHATAPTVETVIPAVAEETTESTPVETWDISASSNDSVTAKLYTDPENEGYYTLSIEGAGDMKDFSKQPWKNYNAQIKKVVIENGITKIGNSAFSDFSSLTFVNIPGSVATIRWNVFSYCNSLKNINIPEGVKSIETNAFYNCSNLTVVNIPKSITSISDSAFSYCNNLKEVHVTDVSAWAKIAFSDFEANPLYYAKHLYCNGELVTEAIIQGVDSIGAYAFYNYQALEKVTIDKSVTFMGDSAFYQCNNLKEVHISNISDWVKITFEYWNSNPLAYAKNLYCNGMLVTEIDIQDANNVGKSAFFGCESLQKVTIGGNVKSLGDSSFRGCVNLETVTVSGDVSSIGLGTFYGCRNLTSVNILARVKSIGDNAFDNCSKLKTINLPEGLTSIGSQAFGYCSSLTSINIPSTVASIGSYAFSNCSGLKGVMNLPEGITVINSYTFIGCSSLTSINIPEGVKTIGSFAFIDCSNLTNVTIDSAEVAEALTDKTACGYLVNYADEIAVRGDIETVGAYVAGFPYSTVLTYDGVEYVVYTQEKHAYTVKSAFLNLNDNINVVYRMSVPAGYEDAYAVFEFQGEAYDVKEYTVDSNGLLCFTFSKVMPQYMADNICVTLYAMQDGVEVGKTKATYSVKEYCEYMLSSTTDEKLIRLISDMLYYGEMTQNYRNYNEDAPITGGMDITPSEFVEMDESHNKLLLTGDKGAIDWKGAGLFLENDMTVRFKFVAESLTGLTVEVSVNGRTNVFTESDFVYENGAYYAYFKGVAAHEFDDAFTAIIKKDGAQVGRTLTYSVNSYIYDAQGKATGDLLALVKAIYNYGASALAYNQAN